MLQKKITIKYSYPFQHASNSTFEQFMSGCIFFHVVWWIVLAEADFSRDKSLRKKEETAMEDIRL